MFLATASEEIKQIVYDEIKSVPGLSIVSKTENSFTAEITDRVNEKIWHQQTSLLFKRINDLQKKGTNEKQRAADFHAFTPDSKQPTSTLFVPPKTKVKTRPHTPPPAWYFGDDTLNQDPEPETPRYVTLKFANGKTLRVKTTYLNRLKNKDGYETGITVFFNPKAGDIAKCRLSNPTEYDNAKKCALRATTCGPVNKKGMKFIGSSFWEVKLPGHDARVSGSEETVTCIHDDGMQEKISIIHLNQYTRSAHA